MGLVATDPNNCTIRLRRNSTTHATVSARRLDGIPDAGMAYPRISAPFNEKNTWSAFQFSLVCRCAPSIKALGFAIFQTDHPVMQWARPDCAMNDALRQCPLYVGICRAVPNLGITGSEDGNISPGVEITRAPI